MARSGTALTGSIMAMIAAALMFDDDEKVPAPSPSGDEPGSGREETVEPDSAESGRQ